jgi:O-acetyl-ADP-ribose deacetylase (regulator of RNase III)
MGAGVAWAIRKKWHHVFGAYYKWLQAGEAGLGSCQIVSAEPGISVANIIGQRGVGFDDDGNPPIRYEALEKGLRFASDFVRQKGASLHLPRMGAGLAGGDWDIIYGIIERCCSDIDTTIYEFD